MLLDHLPHLLLLALLLAHRFGLLDRLLSVKQVKTAADLLSDLASVVSAYKEAKHDPEGIVKALKDALEDLGTEKSQE